MILNEAQTKASKHDQGPMLVIAGPGSGKTTVIAARTVNLIQNCKVDPSAILVITFTRAAAQNMKARFLAAVGIQDTAVNFSTLHSLFYKILSYYTNLKASNIISEEQKHTIIQEIILKLRINVDDRTELIRQSATNISSIKSGNPDSLDKGSVFVEYFKEIYYHYSEYLKKNRLLDFDDLILYCYRLLNYKPEILNTCRKKFQYIMVDEFQDISFLQYKIIKMLSEPSKNLFVVGDDDQSIYAFRGAKPKIMLDFPKDFPDTKIIKLNINYRSGHKIITAAEKIIKHNVKRYSKQIRSSDNKEDEIFLVHTANLYKQNEYILNTLSKFKNRYGSFAILSRTNREQTGIINCLLHHNIPFIAKDGAGNLFHSMTSLDLFAYLEAAAELKSSSKIERSIFTRIMNKPGRYIERAALRESTVEEKALQRAHITKYWVFGKINSLFSDLKKLANLKPAAAIDYIYNEINYKSYLEDYCNKSNLSFEEFETKILELKELSTDFNNLTELKEFARTFEQKINQSVRMQNENAVTISTFHSAKGLEFDKVIIINCVNGITPYMKSKEKQATDTEEERRLFYVGVTRAKESLYLIVPEHMYGKPKQRSIFIDELLS